ncbi:hypothetical protein Ciccas_006004 [Cichlidogyrus casuarinus]|uniref:Ubiquitin-like domain-containing protein n=1 Tax=Cichlidogyrus casuarinus TaxID=1844966 RepID=A0ABD2Q720_9PLAT
MGNSNCIQAISDASQDVISYRIRPFRRQASIFIFTASAAKSVPICWERIRWSCQVSLTASQLKRKRDEFWDTAPAFDGRKEIWDALKAAVDALYKNELDFAQAIIDGANIIAPTGSLLDCYDELGSRYQVPVYVLWDPINLIDDLNPSPAHSTAIVCDELSSSSDSSQRVASNSQQSPNPPRSSRFTSTFVKLFKLRRDDNSSSNGSKCRKRKKYTKSRKSHSRHLSDGETPSNSDLRQSQQSEQQSLRLRFSSGEDYTCSVYLTDTIATAKMKAEAISYWPVARQRWFCAGKMLPNYAKILDCGIPEGFLIQVIVHCPFDPESGWSKKRQAHLRSIAQKNFTADSATQASPQQALVVAT